MPTCRSIIPFNSSDILGMLLEESILLKLFILIQRFIQGQKENCNSTTFITTIKLFLYVVLSLYTNSLNASCYDITIQAE